MRPCASAPGSALKLTPSGLSSPPSSPTVGFDQSRKAVLTTCTLTPPARLLKRRPSSSVKPGAGGSGRQINCCFSFTVTRDGWGVPMGVMGNFLQIGG